jgi:hypothetical protein
MWVFERSSLDEMRLVSDGMAFSEEIKIEAITGKRIGFKEIYIDYSTRMGEIKLQPWRDGFRNLCFLFRKRFSLVSGRETGIAFADTQEKQG